jgi:tetraether lipid synthase
MIDPEVLIEGGHNTIAYEKEDIVRDKLFDLFSTHHSPGSQAGAMNDLLDEIPAMSSLGKLSYASIFRVLIVQFIDAHSFDLRSIRKSCVHIVHPDGKRAIPFDTYNMFYRDELENTLLADIRREREQTKLSGPISKSVRSFG